MALTLFESQAGLSQGRIEPSGTTPTDGDFVFCLGRDVAQGSLEDFEIGDFVGVQALIDMTTSPDFLRFQGRFRQPAGMLTREALPAPVSVERMTHGASPDLSSLTVATAFFGVQHLHQEVRLQGTGITTGRYRIANIVSPTVVELATNPLAAPGGPTVVDTLAVTVGCYWQFDLELDNRILFEYSVGRDGGTGRNIEMPNVVIPVFRFQPPPTVTPLLKCRLTLIEASL